MCLIPFCVTGFCELKIAPLLSPYSGTCGIGFPNSSKRILYHAQSRAQSESAIYLAVVEDIETRVCVLECHLTLAFAKEKKYPCVDLHFRSGSVLSSP